MKISDLIATYKVLQRREVPVSEINMTIAGRIVETFLVHGGEKSVCVRLASGMMAWGFGACWESAELAAVAAAKSVV